MIKRKNGRASPKKLQAEWARGEPYEAVVSTMMLRSRWNKLRNTTGHYGLAAEDYTHFTSPISRYPDHRWSVITGKRQVIIEEKEEAVLEKMEVVLAAWANHRWNGLRRGGTMWTHWRKPNYMQDTKSAKFLLVSVKLCTTKFGMFVECLSMQ